MIDLTQKYNMRLLQLVAAIVLHFSFSIASPFLVPTGPLQHTDGGVILTTGIATRTLDGHVYIRRDVRDLKANFPDQWNLFMLGLRSFYAIDENVAASYYQIAGIHGRPYRAWQGAQGVPGGTGGYCPHNTDLFMTWHRPFLTLYEQELYNHIRDIAYSFPPALKDRYISAADSFRIPYWDWGLGLAGGSVPDFFTAETITIVGTNGFQQIIQNPLHHYEFHPLISADGFDGTFASWNKTLRWPTSTLVNAASQNNLFISSYDLYRRTTQDALSTAFTWLTTVNQYSEKTEDTHGYIHFNIGNGNPGQIPGHMWPLEYSAFEPLFWLHHANVDRLWALWQAVHPDRRLLPSTIRAGSGNFWLASGQTVDGDTPLPPFYNTPSTFWTSNAISDTSVLGYAYPETQSWKFNTSDAYRASVNATIAQLYSGSARSMLTSNQEGKGGTNLQHLLSENTYLDWTIRVEASPTALPPTFFLKFSLVGDFSSDTITDVGTWIVQRVNHTHFDSQQYGDGQNASEQNLTSIISLTSSLLDNVAEGKLESLAAGDVVPYLKDKLTWILTTVDGNVKSQKDPRSLSIQVISTSVHIPDDANMPLEYIGDSVVHREITNDKAGGAKL